MIKYSIYGFKLAFQRELSPLLESIHSSGVTPNMLTLGACGLSLLTGIILIIFPSPSFFLILPFFFLFRMALNALDGMLATKYDMQSKLGAYLNEICDVISDIILYLPFFLFSFIPTFLLTILICLSLITEFSGLALVVAGEKRNFQGPFGKSDRAVFFSILGTMVFLDFQNKTYYQIIISIGILLCILTIWNRGSSLFGKTDSK